MVYHLHWISNIELSLHPCDKFHLIIVYNLLNVLLNSACKYFVQDFCIYAHQWYLPVIFSFCDIVVGVWYQDDAAGLIECVQKYTFLFNFLE